MTENADLEVVSSHSYLQNDDKEIHCIQQQSVAKLSRNELEDLFYQLHDENIHLKRQFNSLDNKYKVMSTRVMRLSRDHKCVESANREEDQKQLRQLRQNETALRAKLTVLRGQLASHTRLHSAALSKFQRPRSHRCSRGCRVGPCSSCGGDDRMEFALDSSRTGSQSQERVNQSSSHSPSQSVGRQGSRDLPTTNVALQEQVVTLQERITVLEKDMEFASEQSRQRISELEEELASRLSHETAENVELIRARRINKQQEAVIAILQQEHQEILLQFEASKNALTLAARDQDEMCSALERERQRNIDCQQEIVKLTHMCASLRDVEEQLNDLKKENAVLKEHSNKLLQLADSHYGSGDAEQVKVISEHIQETSVSKEEHSLAERKLNDLLKEQSLLQQKLEGAQNEVVVLQKSLAEANEERYRIHQELSKTRKDCLDLQKELAKPTEERKELTKKLDEVRSECVRLEIEISKGKTELQEQQLQLSQTQQELCRTIENESVVNKSHEEVKTTANASTYSQTYPQSIHLMPQPPARSMFLSGPSQAHSQPVTPRPRIGDACLTLLEQTAIRPTGSSFSGVLGSHGSLQERFIELCLPASSPSTSSTPLPIVEEGHKIISTSGQEPENVQYRPVSTTDHSPKRMSDYRSPRGIGLADTQWELEKCRELLRVQCNLNSIYKKEVASLNHIVRTLTTSTSSGNEPKD